jgi:hypothetical protein
VRPGPGGDHLEPDRTTGATGTNWACRTAGACWTEPGPLTTPDAGSRPPDPGRGPADSGCTDEHSHRNHWAERAGVPGQCRRLPVPRGAGVE